MSKSEKKADCKIASTEIEIKMFCPSFIILRIQRLGVCGGGREDRVCGRAVSIDPSLDLCCFPVQLFY